MASQPTVKVYDASGREKQVTTTVENGKTVHRVGGVKKGPSQTTGGGGGKILKSQKELAKMSKEEREAYFEGLQKRTVERAREIKSAGGLEAYAKKKGGRVQEVYERSVQKSELRKLAKQLPAGYVYDARTGQILRESDIKNLWREKTAQEMFFGKRYSELSAPERKAVEESLKRQKFGKLLEKQLSDKLIESNEFALTTLTKDYRNIGTEKATKSIKEQFEKARSRARSELVSKVESAFEKQGYKVEGGYSTPEGFVVFASPGLTSTPTPQKITSVQYKYEGSSPFEVSATVVRGREKFLGGEGGTGSKEVIVEYEGGAPATQQVKEEKPLSEVEKAWRKRQSFDFAKGTAEFVGGIYGKVKEVGLQALEQNIRAAAPVTYSYSSKGKKEIAGAVKLVGETADTFFVESVGLPSAKLFKYGQSQLAKGQRAVYSEKPLSEKATTYIVETAKGVGAGILTGALLGSAVNVAAKPLQAAAVGTAFSGVSAGIEALSGEEDVFAPKKRIRSAVEGALFLGGESATRGVIQATAPSLLKETFVRSAVSKAATFAGGAGIAEISRSQTTEGVFPTSRQIGESAAIGALFSVPFTLGEAYVRAGGPVPAIRRLKITEFEREQIPKRGGGVEERFVEKGEKTVGVSFALEKSTGEARPLLTIGKKDIFGRRIVLGEFDVVKDSAAIKNRISTVRTVVAPNVEVKGKVDLGERFTLASRESEAFLTKGTQPSGIGYKVTTQEAITGARVPKPTTPTQTLFTRKFLQSVEEARGIRESFETLHRFGRETALMDRPIRPGVFELAVSESEAVGGGRLRDITKDLGKYDRFSKDIVTSLEKRSSDIAGSHISLYGSPRSTLDYPRRFRRIKDIDLTVLTEPEEFAKKVVQDLKEKGWKVRQDPNKPTQVYRKVGKEWKKILDIHGPEPGVGESPPLQSGNYFGAGFTSRYVREVPNTKFSIITTGEQYTRKVASVLEVTPRISEKGALEFRLGPESLERRGKDVADVIDLMLKEGRSKEEAWRVYESLTKKQKRIVIERTREFPEDAEIRRLLKERGVKIPKSEYGKFGESLKVEAKAPEVKGVTVKQASVASSVRKVSSVPQFFSPSRSKTISKPSSVSKSTSKSPFKSPSPSKPPSQSPSPSPSPSVSVSPSYSLISSISSGSPSLSPSPSFSPTPSESPSESPSRYANFFGAPPPVISVGSGGAPQKKRPKSSKEKKEIAFDITAFVKSRSKKKKRKAKKKESPELFTGLKTRDVGQVGFKF